jgi:hypothetical protein
MPSSPGAAHFWGDMASQANEDIASRQTALTSGRLHPEHDDGLQIDSRTSGRSDFMKLMASFVELMSRMGSSLPMASVKNVIEIIAGQNTFAGSRIEQGQHKRSVCVSQFVRRCGINDDPPSSARSARCPLL